MGEAFVEPGGKRDGGDVAMKEGVGEFVDEGFACEVVVGLLPEADEDVALWKGVADAPDAGGGFIEVGEAFEVEEISVLGEEENGGFAMPEVSAVVHTKHKGDSAVFFGDEGYPAGGLFRGQVGVEEEEVGFDEAKWGILSVEVLLDELFPMLGGFL